MKFAMLLLSTALLIIVSRGVISAETGERAHAVTEGIELKPFTPPDADKIPDDEFGAQVRYGRRVFTETGTTASRYVGNDLACANCHLDAGRLANSAPLWAAWVRYPAYRGKNKMVNTMEERIQGCFRYSMNGTPPPADSRELKAIMSYAFWLSKGAPTGEKLPGQGYPAIPDPVKTPDFQRGRTVFLASCALCHGEDGQGTREDGKVVFPPLWGDGSYNWGAGMHRINTAAAFIKANMPLGRGGTLSVQDAWDVALYINSHPRPQDPRYDGSVSATRKAYHQHKCEYGQKRDGYLLGSAGEAR